MKTSIGTTTSTPLAVAVTRGDGLVRELGLVSFGAVLTTLLAQVSVPWEPVPFTLQTMGMAVAGLTLGTKRGALSQLLYLGLGSVGLPVFALGTGGVARLIGPTGGYLVAFVLVAGILGYLAERGWSKSVIGTAAALVAGFTLTLGLGSLWLSAFIGGTAAVQHGIVPFLVPEALKAVLVMFALPLAWRFGPKSDR